MRIKRAKPPYVSRQTRLRPHTGEAIPAAEGGADGRSSNISGLKQINVRRATEILLLTLGPDAGTELPVIKKFKTIKKSRL